MITRYSIAPRILQTLAWYPGRWMLDYFGRLEIVGRENLDRVKKMKGNRGVIFALNHVSELDPIIVLAGLPPFSKLFPMFYVGAPDESFNHNKFGWRRHIYKSWFFRSWGSYPIRAGLKNYEEALTHHLGILDDGQSLTIFPEGGITKDGILREGKGGVAFLANKTDSIIVPVSIAGVFNITKSEFFGRARKIVLTYGKPLEKKELFSNPSNPILDDYKKGARAVMFEIAKGLLQK